MSTQLIIGEGVVGRQLGRNPETFEFAETERYATWQFSLNALD
jgi:hypothetical protein